VVMSSSTASQWSWLFLLVATSCLSAVRPQSLSLGACPSVSVETDFVPAQYAGVWYENRNYFALFQLFQRCVKATYTDNGDGTIGVKNEAVRYLTGRANSITGTARPLDGTNAKLGLTFAGSPFSPRDAPYWVLGTDYTSYAIVWSCNSYGILNSQILWILTRERSPSDATINLALAVIDKNGLNKNKLRLTDQSNCP